MIGRTKLSTIREKLRQTFAQANYNPVVELDQEFRNLKKAQSASAKEIEALESFRTALSRIVEQSKKPGRVKRARPPKKAV